METHGWKPKPLSPSHDLFIVWPRSLKVFLVKCNKETCVPVRRDHIQSRSEVWQISSAGSKLFERFDGFLNPPFLLGQESTIDGSRGRDTASLFVAQGGPRPTARQRARSSPH